MTSGTGCGRARQVRRLFPSSVLFRTGPHSLSFSAQKKNKKNTHRTHTHTHRNTHTHTETHTHTHRNTHTQANLAQTILAQAQDDIASACPSLRFGVGFLCIPVRRRHMPRKGWNQMDVPSGSAPKGSPVAESIFTASSSCCAVPILQRSLLGPFEVVQPFTRDSRRSQAVAGRHRSSP